jgi:hypothetical protein
MKTAKITRGGQISIPPSIRHRWGRHRRRRSSENSWTHCILLAATGESDSLATADGPLIRVAQAEGIQVKELPR